MRKQLILSVVLFLFALTQAIAGEPFPVRGTLPWHNFLSGPTAWDEDQYREYLDWMKKLDLNFLALHCYTGGSERYASYVEPMIRIEYRNVLPEAGYDTSLTARWGYRPLALPDFPFGLAGMFPAPPGSRAFGSKAAVQARTNSERYDRAQALIRRVIEMAHQRGIHVAVGFEFGVYPPELYSVVPVDSYLHASLLPDPTHPASIEILRLTIDDILKAYPGLDWVFLWHQEMEPSGAETELSPAFKALLVRDGHLFSPKSAFSGVRALAYIREAQQYLAWRSPKTRLAIGGWGGGTQLPSILTGLDRGLPKNIVFTCLNPSQGDAPQPDFLAEIAKNREVWAIPWLEGDGRLWHPQPKVSRLREHVRLARRQGLQGVLAIHWRTQDARSNMEAFAQFAHDPENAPSVEQFYAHDCRKQFGEPAALKLAPLLARMDQEHWLDPLRSPVYYPYEPSWGRLDASLRQRLEETLKIIEARMPGAGDAETGNLKWLAANYRFVLLLDKVSEDLEPAYRLKDDSLRGITPAAARIAECHARLEAAPVEQLLRTYASRVRSRGELGVLSSLCQRVWLEYVELRDFLVREGQ